MEIQHVYIVGSKGCGNYGGYETFLDKLTEYHQNHERINYHIAWKGNENKEFTYHGAHCFQVKVPQIGSAQAIYYDVAALNYCIKHIINNQIKNPIVYILACRISLFIIYFKKKIDALGGKIYINPDGHEWMRTKWNICVRKYWKYSEKIMVRNADLLICDSKAIEQYIRDTYQYYHPKTIFIAYGADLTLSKLADNESKLVKWYTQNGVKKKEYYLIVGRFVPENSFEVMIREFMQSRTKRNLVIISTPNTKFQKKLKKKLHYQKDKRIKFVGTIYDQELLKKIRENAFVYFHGHTVGGTNPSLIEALSSTNMNLLVDVCFNREVAGDSALYWGCANGELSRLIEQVDCMSDEEIRDFGDKAKKRVKKEYTWKKIAKMYEKLFLVSND